MKKSLKIVVLAICLMVTACFTACTPLSADSAVKKLLDKGYQTVSMETLEKEDFVDLELDLKGGAYYVSAQKKVQSGGTTAFVRVYIFDKTSDAKKVYDEIFRYNTQTSEYSYKYIRQGKCIIYGNRATLEDFCK